MALGDGTSIQWRILKSPCCLCVLVCLSVAFKHLNHQTDWYKCGEKILMKLEALGELNFQLQTLSNNKEEDMRIFEVWTILLTVHIVCATGSWKNVKIYWVYIDIELWNSKMAALYMFSWVFCCDKNWWWEIGVCILIRC